MTVEQQEDLRKGHAHAVVQPGRQRQEIDADLRSRQRVRDHRLDDFLAAAAIGAADRMLRDFGFHLRDVLNGARAPAARFLAQIAAAVGTNSEDMFFASGDLGWGRAPGTGMALLAPRFARAFARRRLFVDGQHPRRGRGVGLLGPRGFLNELGGHLHKNTHHRFSSLSGYLLGFLSAERALARQQFLAELLRGFLRQRFGSRRGRRDTASPRCGGRWWVPREQTIRHRLGCRGNPCAGGIGKRP